MTDGPTFIVETPNLQKIKIFFVAIFALISISASVWVATQLMQSLSLSITWLEVFIDNHIKNVTPIGLFFLSAVSGLFFVPIPLEPLFLAGLIKGNPPMLSLFLAIAGMLPSHVLDYVIGAKTSRVVLYFISKKKVYKVRRWVSKYGSYAIFVVNVLPAPAPILTFALGITKYNPMRLFTFLLAGVFVKFFILIMISRFF